LINNSDSALLASVAESHIVLTPDRRRRRPDDPFDELTDQGPGKEPAFFCERTRPPRIRPPSGRESLALGRPLAPDRVKPVGLAFLPWPRALAVVIPSNRFRWPNGKTKGG